MEVENKTDESGILTNDMEAQIMADALKAFNEVQEKVVANDQPETKVEETQEQTAEVTEAAPTTDKQPEVKTPDAPVEVAPETKPTYTPAEIEAEFAAHGDLAHLDSSRLSAEGKLIQTAMQRGFTPKLQEAAELRKRFDQMVQEKTALESQRLKEENERKYLEDSEKFGEEQAALMKEVREYKNRVDLMEQRDKEREEQWQAEQNRVAAEAFRVQFNTKAPSYNIPVTQEWEDIVMSRVWTENQRRTIAGRNDFISLDDGLKLVADTMGISNVDNARIILNANPKTMEALKAEWKAEYSQQKNVGPTVIKSAGSGSSGANISKTAQDKPDAKVTDDPNYDAQADMVRVSMELLEEELRKNKT